MPDEIMKQDNINTSDSKLAEPMNTKEQERLDLFVPFVYARKDAEAQVDTRIIYGLVSDTSLDNDHQRCDATWLGKALTEWFDNWGNIRLMHKPIAVGTAIGLTEENPGKWYLTSKIVDTDTIKMVDEGIYKGYSIGISWPKLKQDSTAPMGLIVGGEIIETSLVDRPSNPGAKFALIKAVGLDKDAESGNCCADDPDCCDDDCSDCQNGQCECDGVLKSAKQDGDTDEDQQSSASDIENREAEKAASKKDEQQRKSPPKGYPSDKSQYADPENYRYPTDEAHIQAAISFYNSGKGKNGSSNWTEIGQRIASAASRIYGKKYELQNGKVVSVEAEKKFSEVKGKLLGSSNFLGKGNINPEAVSVAELMGAQELDDAQLAFAIADLVRYLMVRELHEGYEAGDSMSGDMMQLANVYDQMISFGRGEMAESADYMASRIIAQLLTSHSAEQVIESTLSGVDQMANPTANPDGTPVEKIAEACKLIDSATAGCNLDKIGATISKANKEAISDAHDVLAKLAAGDDCDQFMSKRTKMAEDSAATQPEENSKDDTQSIEKAAESTDLKEIIKSALAENNQSIMDAINVRMAGYEESLKIIGDAAKPDGVLQTSVLKSVTTTERDAKVRELTKLADVYMERSLTHTSPEIRTDASQKYLAALKEIDKLNGM